mmetsp:Transcript_16/g.19  ORF Transcript_16/g.19 Transcript_16/m.19 type:complete len:320 (+) Transcript_16:103-1062(+)|eukprot:CAMPEP_0114345884 /NCGR_PEP_ID=MMETSP0101-20121206/12616_1 /TAXON_ID=38822 ORGANISM="Pteridomonas danica, Strain PT" /NCGR_SAMPLE_ID=MMETSP0101 /ASSEMBLY_ACC=CAM_ASM_000211 /LENGTH=319 /DNA_ID=CAMNT_0001482179 /DNA_START=38 /DNA_END=997 /DNA_ORIENTATION=-
MSFSGSFPEDDFRKRTRSQSVSGRPESVAEITKELVGSGVQCCCCFISGNGIALLTAFVLFSTITVVQWFFAQIANSNALKADCTSMGVDAIAFLGNLFAECLPQDSAIGKRRIELTMSGISHMLLLGFTISFILEGIDDAQVQDDDGQAVNGYIVLAFAIGGLLFDSISLLSYKYFGHEESSDNMELAKKELMDDHPAIEDIPKQDDLTCGINTNMCAALLHVLSDLLRSTTTLIEAIIIITISDRGGDICSTQADGIATLAVCSIIVIGASGALLTWMREVYIYITMPETSDNMQKDKENVYSDVYSPVRVDSGARA